MKIAFLGGGHMARAMVAGLHKKAQITVAERSEEKRRALARDFNVEALPQLPADGAADAIVLAVRPPQALAACAALPPYGVLVSVVAGLRCHSIAQASGRAAARIIRTLPNTPAQVGQGMTFGYADAAASAADRALAEEVFSAVGQFAWVEQEPLLEAVTAVSGSAPAYIYHIIESMQAAARELGVDEETAQAAILQTLRGACAMVEANPHQSPAELCDAVAVPGGTTAAALAIIRAADVKGTIIQAMQACTARAQEIGEELAASAK